MERNDKYLGDIFKISSGGTPSRRKPEYFENGNIPWVKTGELKGKYANKPVEYITKEALNNSSAKIFPEKTVLLAMYGATIGACSILDFDACTNQACAALLPTDECNEVFLYYYLTAIKDEIVRKGVGGAQPNISAGLIKKIKIPLPPLPEQKCIAAILDEADKIRQLNKELIQKYEALTQSLFLDMFGDPVMNTKGWEKVELKNVTSKIGSGATPRGGKESYRREGISLIRSMNIYDNKFKYKNLAFIGEEQADKLKNVIVEEYDVLFNITGASICRCSVVPQDVLPARVNQHVSILRPISKMIAPLFLSHLLISENSKIKLLGVGSAGGAIMEAITKETLQKYKIIIPPIALQNKFASRITEIEKQKVLAEQALAKSEDLFNTLLQKVFMPADGHNKG
ncbi:MAG: restriction endonuclease subunit S [Flavobacteriaceae bacterium]|nr:restriction endonuclease subunit S [Flavobacteriaceae bacterium]